MSRYAVLLWGAILLPVLPGCGDGNPGTWSVTGTIHFADGQPLQNGTIEFEAQEYERPITATGEINSDGSFTLGTFAAGDGAIAGEHRVAIISDFQIGTGLERPELIPETRLHPKYRSFKKSGLLLTVGKDAEKNHFEIVVDSADE